MSTQRQWQLNPIDTSRAEPLSRDLGVDPMVATLLLHRGIDEPDVAQRFMAARLADMPDPGLMADIKRAADRLISAVLAGEKVVMAIMMDGITSSAVLTLLSGHFR